MKLRGTNVREKELIKTEEKITGHKRNQKQRSEYRKKQRARETRKEQGKEKKLKNKG
jgi:hypothetical protein